MTATATEPPYENDPADCHVCGKHAIGVGLSYKPPHQWICAECVEIIEHIRAVRRMDPYELKARAGGMDAAAPLIEEFGSDLGEWTEEQALRLCGAIWNGCAKELRRLIREGSAPF